MGRLGNQLFQIASTIGIARALNNAPAFPKWEYQDYFENHLPLLINVNVPAPTVEHGYHFKSYVGTVAVDLALEGYLQSPKYWEGHEDEVKSYFKLTQESFHTAFTNWLEIIKQIPPRKKLETIGLHVRRGDYVDISDRHTDLCSTKYYELALKKMQELLGYKNLQVILFSDDIAYCKEHFKDMSEFYYAPVTDPVIDLFTFSLCDHFIIANSSFSWWAAYLAGNKVSHVVSPGDMIPWFGPAYNQSEYNTRDLIPKEWFQI